MKFTLGTLQIVPVNTWFDLVAEPTKNALEQEPLAGMIDRIGVAEIDPALADTVAFCERYQVGMDQSANCVVLEATRADKKWFAACLVLANTRVDVNGLARRTLDARKVSFALTDQALCRNGHGIWW